MGGPAHRKTTLAQAIAEYLDNDLGQWSKRWNLQEIYNWPVELLNMLH